MGEWLQMIDDEAARLAHAAAGAIVAWLLLVERTLLVALIRRRLRAVKVRHIQIIAEAVGVDPCDLLRLHPAMRGFCVDDEGVQAQRSSQLPQVVDVDLSIAA